MVQNYLFDELTELRLTPQRDQYGQASANIYGKLMATADTDEYILLGAHFDTVRNSPGANDNASGVALVYLVASELVALERRSKNFVFAFFDEEEKWYRGSWHFAKKLVEEKWSLRT